MKEEAEKVMQKTSIISGKESGQRNDVNIVDELPFQKKANVHNVEIKEEKADTDEAKDVKPMVKP